MEIIQKYREMLRQFKEPDLMRNWLVKLFIGLFVLLLFTFLFPYSESIEGAFHVGNVWTQKDLIAPFSFPIYKDARQYEREKSAAVAAVYPVVERRKDIEVAQMESLKTQLLFLKTVSDAHKQWLKSKSDLDSLKFLNFSKILAYNTGVKWEFIDRWIAAESRNDAPFRRIEQTLHTLIAEIYQTGVIDSPVVKQKYKFFALRSGTSEEVIPSEKLYSLVEARSRLRLRLGTSFGESDSFRLAYNLGDAILRPNYEVKERETQQAIRIAIDNVPRTLGFVQEGERIIGKNERITDILKVKLDSFRRVKAEEGSDIDRSSQRLGIFFHVLLIIALYGTYLFLFRKKIFHDNASLGLIGILFSMEGLLAWGLRLLDLALPTEYLIVVPAASMLLAIIFDSRVAFYGTVVLSLLIGGISGNDYSIAFASMIAGCLGAYTVRDISNRTQIFQSLGFVFLGYVLAVLALGMERFESVQMMSIKAAFVFGNALISSMLTYALIILFERVFNITTDLRLVELADINQPLLERLSEEAPGTFHHSLMIGNLAEAAADEIGANSILAKVGAYYHDIGKLFKPEYFMENQVGTASRHAKLKPRMSAKIIIAHVLEGMELARAYHIPEKVVDFIPQHHGTGRLSFFFDRAIKQAASRKNNKEVVQEDDYRYPGPKPQSKETAIVMLADSIEAATRSLTEVTPQKLEMAIDNMIKQRLIEGELDECDLTMRDLNKIKDAYLQIIIGIHHHRIQYPDQEPAEPLVSEAPPVQVPVPSVSPSGEISAIEQAPVLRPSAETPTVTPEQTTISIPGDENPPDNTDDVQT